MITFEKFKKIIVKFINFHQCESKLNNFGIDIIDSPLSETSGFFLDWLWEAYFTEEGIDTISWWMFEYHDIDEEFDADGQYIGEENKEPGMWDKDDNVIPMITIEDLWNEVKDQRLKIVEDTPQEEPKKQQMMSPQELLDTVGDDMYNRICKYFPNIDMLAYTDDENGKKEILDKLGDTKPFLQYTESENESIKLHLNMYSIENFGILLEINVGDYTRYIWQG